jgi:uncharacterized protein YndB with AHSA1/START domain
MLTKRYPVERTAVVPLPPEQAWEAFFGNELRNWAALSDIVVEVRDYRMRPDGTPEYVMVNRMGPMRASHRSDYITYEPPRRSVDETLDSSLGGRYYVDHEPTADGQATIVRHRFEVEPRGLMRLLFPLMRPMFRRSFQRDLDTMVERLSNRTGQREAVVPMSREP